MNKISFPANMGGEISYIRHCLHC